MSDIKGVLQLQGVTAFHPVSKVWPNVVASEFTPSSKPLYAVHEPHRPLDFFFFLVPKTQKPAKQPWLFDYVFASIIIIALEAKGLSLLLKQRVSLFYSVLFFFVIIIICIPKCFAVGKNDSVDLTLRGNEAMYIVPYWLCV